MRHAEASRVEVLIRLAGSNIVTSVADDGCGFDFEVGRAGPGLGILGMQERAAGVGGHIDYRVGEHGGSVVVLTLPTNEEEHTSG